MVDTNHITQLKAFGEITTTNMVVCPFCFQEDVDAWEYNMSDGDSTVVTCGECEQEFQLECSVSIDYTTKKIEKEDES
jgi:transcription elongation factor Elf1